MAKAGKNKRTYKSARARKPPDVPPPITGQHKPLFTEFQGIPFQEFCRDILAEDPAVSTCGQYGKSGARTGDYGVDVLATLKEDDGIIVAQCKNKKSVTGPNIKKWSTDFFEHWDTHWSDKGVRKFILMVGCGLQATAIIGELLRQKKRFADHHIEYEWWANDTIITKLKPHPHIVNRYFGSNASYWVDFICGPQPVVANSDSATISATVSNALVAQLSRATQALSKQAEALLQQAIALWKEGRVVEAETMVLAIRGDATQWDGLEVRVKADVIVLQGKLALEKFDLKHAKDFATEAEALGDFPSIAYLLAIISLHEGDLASIDTRIKKCGGNQAELLKVSAMLQSGQANTALEILSDMDKNEPKNADTLRLLALATMLEGNVSQALAFVDEALLLQPNWKYAKLTSGIVRYYAALSPTQIPKLLPTLPEPVDWMLVKQSEEARRRLSESETAFRSLIASAASQEEKEQLEAWVFATLANNLSTQTEAEAECKRLIGQESTRALGIYWSIARNYIIDPTQIKIYLQQAAAYENPSPEKILADVSLLIKDRKFADAGELLDRLRSIFSARQLESVWLGWRAQIFLLLGNTGDAAQLYNGIEKLPPEFLPLIKNSDDKKQFLGNLDFETLHGRLLLNVCLALSSLRDWEKIATLTDRLIDEVQTEVAVRLAAEALLRTSQFERCLKVLDENGTLFNGQNLPNDLQSFQVKCLQELGMVNEAVAKAERIANDSPNTQTLLNYSRLLVQSGQMKLVSSVAQRLLRRADLTAVQAIKIAEVIFKDDPETAKRLWKRAADQHIKGDFVSRAVVLGYNLGMEGDFRYAACHVRLLQIAQSGSKSIRAVSLDDVVATVKRQREEDRKKFQSYIDASAPAHFLYELPQIYHKASVRDDDRSLVHVPPVFAMHEDRQFAVGFPITKPTWRINLDISAILLAEEFEYLEAILETQDYVRIPSETVAVLLECRQRLQPLPDKHVESISAILSAIKENRIEVFSFDNNWQIGSQTLSVAEKAGAKSEALMQHVEAEGGWFIDVDNADTKESELSGARRKTNAKSVVESLYGQSALSESLLNAAKNLLGSKGESIPIPIRSKLFIHGTTIQSFVMAGLSNLVFDNFEVFMPNEDADFMENELQRHQATLSLQSWLTTLIDRLSLNIQLNKIRLMPVCREPIPDDYQSTQTLIALLQYKPEQTDVIWFDDRYCNGHFHQGNGAPIASSWEVLKALAFGDFGKERYFKTLLKMRNANIRYLPIEAEEIMYHLRQASVNDNAVVETRELTILRQYTAACLSQPEWMHKKQQNKEPILFLTVLRQALIGAWDEVWKSNETFVAKQIRAEWLYDNLFVEPLSLCLISTGESNGSNLAGVLSELMFTSVILFSENHADAASYVKWFEKKCLNPLLSRFSELPVELARSLKQTIAAKLAEEPDSTAVVRLFQWWYYCWPTAVRNEADLDLALMQQLHLRPVSFGHMHGLTFMWDKIENAVRIALSSGTEQEVVTKNLSKIDVSAQVLSDGRLAVTFAGEEKSFSVAHDDIQFAFNTPYQRLLALRRQRHWIDVSSEKFEEVASSLAYLEPASVRLDRLHWFQDNNANNFYSSLFMQMWSDSRLTYTQMLPPSVESLTNHYRLSTTEDFDSLSACRTSLIESVDKFARLVSGLPIQLPDEILSGVGSLPADLYESLVKTLLREMTPLAAIQLIKILDIRAHERRYSILRRRLKKCLLSPEIQAEFEAFSKVLRWIDNRFNALPGFKELPASCKLALAWLHSNKLYALLKASGQPVDWIASVFKKGVTLVGVDLFATTDMTLDDAAASKSVSAERLLVSGIAYCFGDEELRENSERLLEIGLYTVDGVEFWPKPTMFRMPRQLDVLNSYVGMHFEELSQIIPPFEVLTLSRLDTWAKDGIEAIRTGSRAFLGWLIVGQILPRDDQSNEHTKAIRALVAEKGLRQLVRESDSAFATISVAATHCVQDENLVAQLIDELKDIASNSEEYIERSDEAQSRKSELGLNIAFFQAGAILSRRDGKLMLENFANLMIELADRCPSFRQGLASMIFDLWFEVSYEQAASLWRLRARLLAF